LLIMFAAAVLFICGSLSLSAYSYARKKNDFLMLFSYFILGIGWAVFACYPAIMWSKNIFQSILNFSFYSALLILIFGCIVILTRPDPHVTKK
jgi:cytochrome bd-type quinol oxidase subunit 2